jgi:hypothetical protein
MNRFDVVQQFCAWCYNTPLASAIRDSTWLFPAIEASHLLGLALLGGTVLIVDLRLLGWGLRRQTVADVATGVRGWMTAGLIVMLTSGALLFASEAMKCYDSGPFRLKMLSLALALLFTFTIRRRHLARAMHTTHANSEIATGRKDRLVAMASLSLWSSVGLMGRAIGFW